MKRKFWNFEYTLRLMFGDSKNPFGAQITRQQLDEEQRMQLKNGNLRNVYTVQYSSSFKTSSRVQCCGAGQFLGGSGSILESSSTPTRQKQHNFKLQTC